MSKLIQAAKNGYYQEILSLLEGGQSVYLCDDNNATALYWGACRGYSEICEALIQAGSTLDAQVVWGSTPLHAASDRGHFDCVRLLINCGANVNVQNLRGDTALHLSSYRGFINIVQLLIHFRANLFLRNEKNKMACDEALAQGYVNTSNLLKQHMAASENENPYQRERVYGPPSDSDSDNIFSARDWMQGVQWASYSNQPMSDMGQQVNGVESLKDTISSSGGYVRYNTNMTDFRNSSNSNNRTRPEPQENSDDTIDGASGAVRGNKAEAKGETENNPQRRAKQSSAIYQAKNPQLKLPIQAEARTVASPSGAVCIQNGRKQNVSIDSSPVSSDKYSADSDLTPVHELQQHLQTSANNLGNTHVKQIGTDLDKRHLEAIEKFAESLQMELVNQRDSLDIEKRKKMEAEHTVIAMQKRYEEMRHALQQKEMEITRLKIIYHNERKQLLETQLGIREACNSRNSDIKTLSDSLTHEFLFDFLKDIHLDGVALTDDEKVILRLKEKLYRQYLAQEKTPVLDREKREWILGTDYNIIGDQPINQVSDTKRNGACSLVFRISHNARHFILKMMINLINMDATKHGEGYSMKSFLERSFGSEYSIPIELPTHPNIIQVRHYYDGSTAAFQQFMGLIIPMSFDVPIEMATRTTFLVVDEHPTTLMAFMEKQKPVSGLNITFVLHLLYQLLSSVNFLLKNSVAHRDIKADNVFLDNRLRPVLGDFGFAIRLHGIDGEPISFTSPDEALAGNSHAWAPELSRLHREGAIPASQQTRTLDDVYSKTDAYAVSRMMYSLLRPAGSLDEFPQSSINRPNYENSEIPDLPVELPVGLRCVLQHLVLNDPLDRITARRAMLSTGMMLFAPSQGEVTNMTEASIYCQSRMIKLLAMNTQNRCQLDSRRQLTVEESVEVVTPELEADFLYNITSEEFWEIYQCMGQRHLLSK
ncbi:hypothetical protein ScPMuIL_016422 [Solemya velum]